MTNNGAYNKIKKLYNKCHHAQFNMAVAQLMEIGFRSASRLTDEEISQAKGNAFMTDEFWQETLKLVREIAQNYSATELIQFCEVEEPFDIRWFSEHPTRSDLESYVENAINSLSYRGASNEAIIDELSIEDDAEFFGLEYDEEVAEC